ncbi:hypothetical protein [Desulfurivibrio dismutans]|uniref:hypothetical protein n=1 Tax=Desulfurivibrio dismutans TaxID=1398908 RepID=UPI0023DBCE73|nr:hypothetical protein [Desulfurivibrio alkaliphilus]MDF1615473.1 hypothetical protein [Desulfurivibrio alkaliphilus]
MSKKLFFMYKNADYVVDGMRSALGQAVENNYAFGAVMTDMPALDEHNKENVDWIRDMEGEIYSTVPSVCEQNELTPITLEELGQKLREMEYIIPYGVK